MRTLTRIRLLAAVCALLLSFASIANAGAPGRPIDRPEGPPEPIPVQIGDPDEPGGLRIFTFGLFGRVYLVRVPARLAWPSASARRSASRSALNPLDPRRGSHAR